jgi:hypothetical protein
LPEYLAPLAAVRYCALLCARIIGVRSATRISLAVSVHVSVPVLARTTASIVQQLANVRERMGLFFQLFQSAFSSFFGNTPVQRTAMLEIVRSRSGSEFAPCRHNIHINGESVVSGACRALCIPVTRLAKWHSSPK